MHNYEITQLKTQFKSEALCPFLGRYLENKTMNYLNTKIWSWYGLKRLIGDENESLNICIKMISGFEPLRNMLLVLKKGALGYFGFADLANFWLGFSVFALKNCGFSVLVSCAMPGLRFFSNLVFAFRFIVNHDGCFFEFSARFYPIYSTNCVGCYMN